MLFAKSVATLTIAALYRFVYTAALWLAAGCLLAAAVRRYGFRRVPWREYFGFCRLRGGQDKPVLWLHAVSVGEAAAAAVLLRRLSSDRVQLLLTHTTRAGGRWLRERYPEATVCVLPLDMPFCVRRFMRSANPKLGIIMEAEYWPNLLAAAQAHGTPMVLANARLKSKSARRYRCAAPLMRQCIGAFDLILAQTARDAGRLRCFGGRQVVVAGNLKFDSDGGDMPPPGEPLHKKPMVVFAATRPGEEALLLDSVGADFWRRYFVVLAPRHPERRDEIVALLKSRGLRYAVRSRGQAVDERTQCYVADTLGEMAQWYAMCAAAIIGGSFLPYGGQNPIEAMRLGRVAIIGPHTDNYAALVREAVKYGALRQVPTAAEAFAFLASLHPTAATAGAKAAMQKKAAAFSRERTGALSVHLRLILPLLNEEQK